MSKLIKIRLVGTEFHADGQTEEQIDMTKLIFAVRNFASMPNER
jgi:hypothetical protein